VGSSYLQVPFRIHPEHVEQLKGACWRQTLGLWLLPVAHL
jgi:hypothetical protein